MQISNPYHFLEIDKPPVNAPFGSYQIQYLKYYGMTKSLENWDDKIQFLLFFIAPAIQIHPNFFFFFAGQIAAEITGEITAKIALPGFRNPQTNFYVFLFWVGFVSLSLQVKTSDVIGWKQIALTN